MAVSTGHSGQWVHQVLVQPLRPDPTLSWLSVSVQDSGQWIHQVLSPDPTLLWLSVAVHNIGQWSHQILVQPLCPDPIPSVQDMGQWVHRVLGQLLHPDPILQCGTLVSGFSKPLSKVMVRLDPILSWLSLMSVQDTYQWNHQVPVQLLSTDPILSGLLVQDTGQ